MTTLDQEFDRPALEASVAAFAAAVEAEAAAAAAADRPPVRTESASDGAPAAAPLAVGAPSLRAAFVASGAASLVVLAAINGVDYAVSAALAVLAPDIERTLHLSDAQLLTTVSLTALFFAAAAVPVGIVSDRRPRPRVTGVLTVVAGLATLATGGARSGLQLGGARVLTGAAQSGIQVTHLPLLADTYPVGSRPRVFAVHSLMPSLAVLVGPLVAGPMAALIGGGAGWRWPFVLLGCLSVLLGLLALRLPEPRRGAAADGRPGERAALGQSLARLMRIRSLTGLLAALAVLGAVLIAVPSLLSLYLERVQHLGASGRGVVSAVVGLGAVAGLLAGAPLGQRVLAGQPQRAVRMLALSLCLYAVLLSASLQLPGLVAVTAGVTVASFFGQLGIVPLYTSVTAIVPARLRSLAFALVGLAVVLGGGLVGSVVGGALSDDHGTVFALTALLLVTTPVAALVLLGAGRHLAGDIDAVAREALVVVEPPSAGAPLLAVRGLSVSLGGQRILHAVDLEVHRGEVLALLGTNGAGKSTLLRALSGLLAADTGTVRLDGQEISEAGTPARIAAGLVQVAGGRAVFPDLTVAENLLVGAHTFAWDRARTARETARVVALFPVLGDRMRQRAGSLSGGEQQLLGIAKALLLRPRVLLVDELTLGLSPVAVGHLLDVVAQLRIEGVTLVVVEQSLTTALAVADRAVFLERGRVRFDGPPAELAARTDLARAVFLGAEGG